MAVQKRARPHGAGAACRRRGRQRPLARGEWSPGGFCGVSAGAGAAPDQRGGDDDQACGPDRPHGHRRALFTGAARGSEQ